MAFMGMWLYLMCNFMLGLWNAIIWHIGYSIPSTKQWEFCACNIYLRNMYTIIWTTYCRPSLHKWEEKRDNFDILIKYQEECKLYFLCFWVTYWGFYVLLPYMGLFIVLLGHACNLFFCFLLPMIPNCWRKFFRNCNLIHSFCTWLFWWGRGLN